jgi:hypothetical protein
MTLVRFNCYRLYTGPYLKIWRPGHIIYAPLTKINNNNIGNTNYFVHNRDYLILKYNL